METFSAGNSPVNSTHKGQWRGTLMFSLISAWINDWINNSEAGVLRRHRAYHDVIVMVSCLLYDIISLWIAPFTFYQLPCHQLLLLHRNIKIPYHSDPSYLVKYIWFGCGNLITWPRANENVEGSDVLYDLHSGRYFPARYCCCKLMSHPYQCTFQHELD